MRSAFSQRVSRRSGVLPGLAESAETRTFDTGTIRGQTCRCGRAIRGRLGASGASGAKPKAVRPAFRLARWRRVCRGAI